MDVIFLGLLTDGDKSGQGVLSSEVLAEVSDPHDFTDDFDGHFRFQSMTSVAYSNLSSSRASVVTELAVCAGKSA